MNKYVYPLPSHTGSTVLNAFLKARFPQLNNLIVVRRLMWFFFTKKVEKCTELNARVFQVAIFYIYTEILP